jgi:hypothetical protein
MSLCGSKLAPGFGNDWISQYSWANRLLNAISKSQTMQGSLGIGKLKDSHHKVNESF